MTDEPTMEIAEMVLNKVNKSLVQLVNELAGLKGREKLARYAVDSVIRYEGK